MKHREAHGGDQVDRSADFDPLSLNLTVGDFKWKLFQISSYLPNHATKPRYLVLQNIILNKTMLFVVLPDKMPF